jgi:hypothetical protein
LLKKGDPPTLLVYLQRRKKKKIAENCHKPPKFGKKNRQTYIKGTKNGAKDVNKGLFHTAGEKSV